MPATASPPTVELFPCRRREKWRTYRAYRIQFGAWTRCRLLEYGKGVEQKVGGNTRSPRAPLDLLIIDVGTATREDCGAAERWIFWNARISLVVGWVHTSRAVEKGCVPGDHKACIHARRLNVIFPIPAAGCDRSLGTPGDLVDRVPDFPDYLHSSIS